MAWRGTHEFPLILTSDGSMNHYPENKTSKFKILLKEPLELEDDSWEVCLWSINYPFSWTNVGPSAKVYMKYCSPQTAGVQEMEFPDWQCTTMEEVVKFIGNEVMTKAKDSGSPRIMFELDELGRVRIENRGGYYDLGFTDNMLKLLGLAGSPYAEYLRMKNFDARQKIRDTLNNVWLDGYKFDYGDEFVAQGVMASETEEEFADIIKAFLNIGVLPGFYQNNALEIEAANARPGMHAESLTEVSDLRSDVLLNELLPGQFVYDKLAKKFVTVGSTILVQGDKAEHQQPDTPPDSMLMSQRTLLASYRRSFKYMMRLMKSLYRSGGLPKTLRASTPGVLNPVQRMFVYANIIDPIDVNNQFVRLLKLVNTRGESFKTTQEDFLHPMYHPVQKGKISLLDILIADENGDPVSFQIGTVVLTLHFRKVSRNRSK